MQYVTAGVLLAEQLHCASNDIPCFRNRSTSEIIAAQAAVNTMLTSLNALFFFEPWLPVIDNVIVNGSLLDTVFKTSFQLKELIIGTLTDECYDFVYSMWGKPITTQDYLALAILLFKEKGLKVIERYPPNSSGDQRLVIV
ncbi:MAG: carboxylesterase family protein, partial [Bacteroidia bacterium]|nr:carboxylesterase family protein [Bacteroidia bacterium]